LNITPTYSVVVLPSSASLNVGQTQQFQAYLVVNGAISSDVPFTWSTIGGVGSVDQNGLFVATSPGSGFVVATYGAGVASGTASVSVSSTNATNLTTSLFIVPPNATVYLNGTQQFTIYFQFSNGTVLPVPNNVLGWSVLGGIGTITGTGLFTATSVGTGAVTAVYTGPVPIGFINTVSAPVAVLSPVSNFTNVSFQVVPQFSNLTIGQAQQFDAQIVVNGVPTSVNANWSVVGSAGTINPSGLFTATSSGSAMVIANYFYAATNSSFQAMAYVNVFSTNSTSVSFHVVPQFSNLTIGQTQQFVAELTINGVASQVNATWSTVGSSGTIDVNGLFTATSVGQTMVIATYPYSATNTSYQAMAFVDVSNTPPPLPSYIVITPNPASLYVGQTQQFIATAYDFANASLGVVSNSNLAWSVDNTAIGTISANGIFSAVSAGNAVVSASYGQLSANASVSVSTAPPNPVGGSGGSSGGSGSGGGSYKTATTVSFSCAGKIGEVKITVFDPSTKNATVDIIYMGDKREKVFSKDITGTTTLSFTPSKAGDYELHVSVGADQQTARFFVPYCGPQTVNITQNVTVKLEPRRELIFTKLVNYPGGFSKLFSVYKITEGQSENFESTIVLYFNYTGNSTKYDFDIIDSVPTSVITRTSQISFADKPSVASSEPRFEWNVRSISKGGKLSYAYSFARPLTEQMIALFDAPSIRSAEDAASQAKAAQDGGLLSASIGPLFGIKLPLIGVVLAFIVLLALLYFFLFARNKEE